MLKNLPKPIRRFIGLHLLVLWYGGAHVVVLLMVATSSFWPLLLVPMAAFAVHVVQCHYDALPPVPQDPAETVITRWEPPEGEWAGGVWNFSQTPEGTEAFEWTDEDAPVPASSDGPESEQVEFLKRRLNEEIHARFRAQALVLDGPASARITGRVVRIEMKSEEAVQRHLWIAVEDEGDYQAIRVKAASGDVAQVYKGDRVTLACHWRFGRLTVLEVEQRAKCDDPLPDLKLPEPKDKANAQAKDGQLPSMDELSDQTKGDGWGSLNHSKYRCPIAWHLTTSPKFRAKSFEGKATEVQAILREVAEAEGLTVIAIAAEADHVHLLGIPGGTGGMPPTWQWSRWIGRWKAVTSKKLKDLPGLEDFTWQVGYALTSVSGGKQGAEEALKVVQAYVEAQGDQKGGEPQDAA